MGDSCIAGNNGEPDKKAGDSSGDDDTGAETKKSKENLLPHTRASNLVQNKEICTFGSLSVFIIKKYKKNMRIFKYF